MVRIVCGPIVGLVTRHSVRLLLEFDGNVHVDITATEKMAPDVQTQISRKFYANRAKAVTIGDLKEKTEYIFSFRTNQDTIADEEADIELIDEKTRSLPLQKTSIEDAVEYKARAITLGAHLQNIRVAVVSGNDGTPQTPDLYCLVEEKIFKNQMKPLDAVFHVGNLVDGQTLFKEARKAIEGGAEDDAACDIYRAAYRKLFRQKGLRDLLGKVGNFLVGSQRDIGVEKIEGELDERVAKIAKRAYNEYQRQLWSEHFDGSHEGHAHLFGDHMGILFLDQFMGKTFTQEKEVTLTEKQWQDMEQLFAPRQEQETEEEGEKKEVSPIGMFATIKGLVVVTNEPVLFLNENTEKIPDADDWAHGKQKEERDKFLSMLFKWKSESNLREVVIVSGNSANCGGHSLITHNGAQISQFVTSPIASTPLCKGVTIPPEGKSGDYSFTHFDWVTEERNFGVVDVLHPNSVGKPMFEHFIIREKSTSQAKTGGGTWVIPEEKEKGGCCIIA
jgi:hypothetical protein